MTPRWVRCDIRDQRAHDESTDPIDANEPIERTAHADPTDPIDMNDPTDPIESIEPFDPIERNESSDHSESRELVDLIAPVSRAKKEGPPDAPGAPHP
jgi:hypothetical protein